VTFVINAPFGRFAPTGKSILIFDGRKSWIVMELVSPVLFTYFFLSSPLSRGEPVSFQPSPTQYFLAGAYLIHYANRALISPLRTPSRSKSHIIVTLAGISFNILNGSLMGTYLSSPAAHAYLSESRPSFYIGLALWALGFAGNVIHDEILLNIRRKAKSKADGKVENGKTTQTEHYAIPYGLLYKYISFPNYFCEWIEWFGFALAASPLPFDSASLASIGSSMPRILSPSALLAFLRAPSSFFAPRFTAPWIFLLNEIVLMVPRAYKGHQWYKRKFGESYPKKRKVAIPFIW
jgi:3-oxo-5-alpha-steroid 4-dehydrogenase 1